MTHAAKIVAGTVGIFFLMLSPVFAEKFENQSFSLSENGGTFLEPLSLELTPKNNETIFWSFARENPTNLHSTTEATRIFIPRNRNLYVFPHDGLVEKFSFKIKKYLKNTAFRILEIDSTPAKNFLPTVTIQNTSNYSFSLHGWKIQSEFSEKILPDEELEGGEIRRFIVDINTEDEVLLISPSQRVRDRASAPPHASSAEISPQPNTSSS